MKKTKKSAIKKKAGNVRRVQTQSKVKSKSKKSVRTSAKVSKVKSRRLSKSERRRGVLGPVYKRLLTRGIVIERRRYAERRVQ